MLTSNTQIQTQNARRLMNRLCKHWGHKFPVSLSEQQGRIELPLGICRLSCATDSLAVELKSDAEHMQQMQQVVAEHLLRMASGEELIIEWHDS